MIPRDRKWITLIAVGIAASAVAAPCFAFHEGGHNIIAGIAYDELKRNRPDVLETIVTLLKKHPHYEEKWLPKLKEVANGSKRRYMFMLAANWPDAIRHDNQYDHPTWHYVDVPYKPEGQPDSLKPHVPDGEYLDFAYPNNLAIAADKTNSAAARAVALCWIFHLLGDIHQPLHSTSLFTTDYPDGDRGGNLILTRLKEGDEVRPLHFFWDCWVLPGYPSYGESDRKIAELRGKPEYARDNMPETGDLRLAGWIEASHRIAIQQVYCNRKIPGSPRRDAAPVLSEEYQKDAVRISERQIMLAGYRLGNVMAKLFSTAN